MNTIEILVLILMGFLILNSSMNRIIEGLENTEDGVTKLLKQAQDLTLKNSHQIDTVVKALETTLQDYQGLQKKLKNVKKNSDTDKAVNHGGHSSVPPAPTNVSVTMPTPPKGPCPSKYLKIRWPSVAREGMSTRQLNSQVKMIWNPQFSKVQQTQNSLQNKIVGSASFRVLIEMVGNQIQDTLQKKKF